MKSKKRESRPGAIPVVRPVGQGGFMMLPVHVPRKTIAAAIRADRDQTRRPMKPIDFKPQQIIDASAKNLKKGQVSGTSAVTKFLKSQLRRKERSHR